MSSAWLRHSSSSLMTGSTCRADKVVVAARAWIRSIVACPVRHATAEVAYLELDLTLALPLRYGLGFMLGGSLPNLFGYDNPHAFGHVGFTNTITWADPERRLAVALLASGKPVISTHAIRLFQLLVEITQAFPKIAPGHAAGDQAF